MKVIVFAAVAAAFVFPDVLMFKELVLGDNTHPDSPSSASQCPDAQKRPTLNDAKSVDTLNNWLRNGFAQAGEIGEPTVLSDEGYGLRFSSLQSQDPVADLTIHQLISASNYTTKFAALVNRFPHFVDQLNSTAADFTLFVPVDAAFDKLPIGLLNDTKNPYLVENIVRYPITLGAHSYKRLSGTHTIPTALNEPMLGGEPQRLRIRPKKHRSLQVNFYSNVIATNFIAKNGIIHGVDTVIVPPTYVGPKLALDPARYSTYMWAMQRTGFVQYIHDLVMTGSTAFAISNTAFERLGPRVNAFLFNTPKGLKYLNAICMYSIVPNATVYSDAYYGPSQWETTADTSAETTAGGCSGKRRHYTLPTLLTDATMSVKVSRTARFPSIVVNDEVRVAVQDTMARNGVVQEIDRVLLPPHQKYHNGKDASWEDDEAVPTLEDIVARLDPYVGVVDKDGNTY